MAAKERKLRMISINDGEIILLKIVNKKKVRNLDHILLSSGINCINIESTITCYGININRSVCLFISY